MLWCSPRLEHLSCPFFRAEHERAFIHMILVTRDESSYDAVTVKNIIVTHSLLTNSERSCDRLTVCAAFDRVK